jgi:NADPH-dependent glutamate synthase beta subunit-like oxidoreductase
VIPVLIRSNEQGCYLGGEMPDGTYDVIVIGAGPTGENVADRAVRGGLTAVIVESELVGGPRCSPDSGDPDSPGSGLP